MKRTDFSGTGDMDIIVAEILSEDRKDCLRGKQMCFGLPAGFKGHLPLQDFCLALTE